MLCRLIYIALVQDLLPGRWTVLFIGYLRCLYSCFPYSDCLSWWHHREVWDLGHSGSRALPQPGSNVLQRCSSSHCGLRHYQCSRFHTWGNIYEACRYCFVSFICFIVLLLPLDTTLSGRMQNTLVTIIELFIVTWVLIQYALILKIK